METSRDDFVIAIRSAFLKKGTQQRFSLLGLIFFSIIFIVLGSFNLKPIDQLKSVIKEIVYRSSFIVSIPENFIKKSYIITNDHLNLYNENKKIKLELEILKAKDLVNDFIISENKKLKSIVDDYLIVSNEIIAKILIDKQSPFLKSVVANKGSKDNIKLGMIALDGLYLVGKVVEVNYLTSRILLLSDLNSKIPVIIEPKGIHSILSGSGEDIGVIQYTRNENLVENDSIIYTSGSGGLFKSGIPIGRINNSNVSAEQKVNFFSDFSQLNFVKIISFKSEDPK
jgi:rod shape-determining protein MreC